MGDGSVLEDVEEDAAAAMRRRCAGHGLCRRWRRVGKENLDGRVVGRRRLRFAVAAMAGAFLGDGRGGSRPAGHASAYPRGLDAVSGWPLP
jgi:hypothetical protein